MTTRRSSRTFGTTLVVAALLLTACQASSVPASTAAAVVTTGSTAAPRTPAFRMVAVGDIAERGGGQMRTAAVTETRDPDAVVILGDAAYPNASSEDFENWYDPSFGQFLDITWPLPGNHEYRTPDAAGFTQYFGVTRPMWWAHRAGAWLVIGLDSELAWSTEQQMFVRATLAENDGIPTIVAWHRARFSLGEHGDQPDTGALWSLVRKDPDVRIALWGHDHDYERMAITSASRPSEIQAFVVGTGGGTLRDFGFDQRPMSKVRIARRYGVLELRLRATGWSWAFIQGNGVIADHGSRTL